MNSHCESVTVHWFKFRERTKHRTTDFYNMRQRKKYLFEPNKLFYILIINEKILVLFEKWLSKFSSNLYVLRPPESEKTVFTSVCLSVAGRILDNSRKNYRIELSFGILSRSRKSKNKFVNQSHPTKIIKIGAFFVFLKKSKISILVSDSFHKSLLIILITFFD